MTEQRTIHVVLVDDHPMIRSGLRLILSGTDDIVVVGEASNGAEAIQLVGELQPNVVVMDVMMPELDGISATKQLLQRYPRLHVLALTSFSEGDVSDARAPGRSLRLPPEECRGARAGCGNPRG